MTSCPNLERRVALRQQESLPKLHALHERLATAKINGLEPYAWLKDTLEKLPSWPYSRIDELLPLAKSDA